MFENVISPREGDFNLRSYQEAYESFSWDRVGREFSWYETGRINIAYEAIDRHALDPDKAARSCLIFAGRGGTVRITYEQMRTLSNKFGNVLRGLGVEKGDRVFLLMPRIPELYVAMLGIAKVGAIIAPLYSSYREGAIKERMLDGQGKVLVTTPRHRKRVPADELPELEHIIITSGAAGPWEEGEITWHTASPVVKDGEQIVMLGDEPSILEEGEVLWADVMAKASAELEIEWVAPDDSLLLIYASGQDGRPIGLLHAHDVMRGYLVTARWVLDLKDGDVLWTMARPGWLMNIVYSAFAPWLCGVESFVTGQVDSAEELYRHIEQQKVSVLYSTPTVYRLLIEAGEETAERFSLQSLRHLLSVLEPLFPDVIYAAMRILGLPVYDTWWTAETGMITVANYPCLPIKPGYLGKPFPGIHVAILDSRGREAAPFNMGELAIRVPWPSMTRGIWNHNELYERFFRNKPWFMSGDTAFFDHDNYFFYQGRADDAMITAAGRIGIGEIESILLRHPAIAEACVMRVFAPEGGKKIKAYVALKLNYKPSQLIKNKIMAYVQNNLSPETAPSDIEFRSSLPKDKSGAVLRRVIKAMELGLPVGNLQDLLSE